MVARDVNRETCFLIEAASLLMPALPLLQKPLQMKKMMNS
jgi:hypothetical protein